jgi:hypothetical protein
MRLPRRAQKLRAASLIRTRLGWGRMQRNASLAASRGGAAAFSGKRRSSLAAQRPHCARPLPPVSLRACAGRRRLVAGRPGPEQTTLQTHVPPPNTTPAPASATSSGAFCSRANRQLPARERQECGPALGFELHTICASGWAPYRRPWRRIRRFGETCYPPGELRPLTTRLRRLARARAQRARPQAIIPARWLIALARK